MPVTIRVRTGMHRARLRARHNSGFTIVEVIVAMVLLVMVAAGASALATGSTKAQTTSKVRQRQAAIAEGAMEKVKSETAWGKSAACKTAIQPQPPCIISYVINSPPDPDLLDATTGIGYVVSAAAQGIDSSGDDTGPSDNDGLVPDYYRVVVTVQLDAVAKVRFPSMRPITLSADVNQATRVDQGSLIIQACSVYPQADERIPIAACPKNATQPTELIPPTGLDWETFSGTVTCNTETDGKDCASYKCSNPEYASQCFDRNYYEPPDVNYVELDIQPGKNWDWAVSGSDSNTAGYNQNGKLNADGIQILKGLKPGQYTVTITPKNPTPVGGQWLLWDSHSIPAGGFATVEPGLESRVIQMFRHSERSSYFRISLRSVDTTDPWNNVTYDYLHPDVGGISGRMVPSPLGRVPFGPVRGASPPATYINFPNPEPGLYAGYLSNSTSSYYYNLSNHPGFLFVDPDPSVATIPPSDPYSSRAFWTLYWCDAARRIAMNQGGFFGPDLTGWIYTHWHDTSYTDANGVYISQGYSETHNDPDGIPDTPWYPCPGGGGGGGAPPPGAGGGGGS